MSLKPSEWLLMRAAIAVGGGLLGLLLGSGNLVLGVMVVRRRTRRALVLPPEEAQQAPQRPSARAWPTPCS